MSHSDTSVNAGGAVRSLDEPPEGNLGATGATNSACEVSKLPNPLQGKYQYFTTINLSPKLVVTAKWYDTAKRKMLRGKIKWGDLKQQEQHAFFIYGLTKFVNTYNTPLNPMQYHFFFEQTMNGEIHTHGRIGTDTLTCIKDFELCLLGSMQISRIENKHAIKTYKYDHTRWNDYHKKVSPNKERQITSFKPFSNLGNTQIQ